MTDSSDPSRPNSRPSREPPTLDLTATVVDEGARGERAASEEGQTPSEAERADAAQEAMLEGGPSDDPAAAERPAAEPLRPAEPEARRGPGVGALAGAGLVGGLVGAGALLAFQAWRPEPAPNDPRIAVLEQRIAALPRPDMAGIERRLAAVEAARNELAQRLQAAQTLAERGAARAEEAFNRPQTPAAAAPAPADDGALAQLGDRVGALETHLRDQGQAAAAEREASRRSVDAAVAAAQGLERRVLEQEQRMAALVRQAEGGSQAARAGTRLVLANRLDAALRDGAPYAEALAGLRRLDADPARIAALEPFAEGGAPTAAALAQSFKPLAGRIAGESAKPAAAPPSSTADSWSDRVLGLVGQVVTIRPVDAPSGQSSGGAQPSAASAAAVEQALARSDFAAAASAWDALPEAARQLSADWGRQLKQRAAADAASRALAADAVAALNSSTR